MTFKDKILQLVTKNAHAEWRYGQSIMNQIGMFYADIYGLLTCFEEYNCFYSSYDGEEIQNLLNLLEKFDEDEDKKLYNSLLASLQQRVVDDLQGTIQSFEECIAKHGITENHRFYDDIVDAVDECLFECTDCGWWYEVCEEADMEEYEDGVRICESCYEYKD